MVQRIEGKEVYVVNFDTMPELPITASTLDEAPYALALETAIRGGIITEPGKYGIHLDGTNYTIYRILERNLN